MSKSNKIVWTKSNGESVEIDEANTLQFKDLVDRTLALQGDSPINKFSLKYYFDENNEKMKMAYVDPPMCNAEETAYMSPWICDAVDRGVLELDLSLNTRYVTFLPSEVFACKTLVKLTLGTKLGLGKLPLDTSLPALKSLFLDSVFFLDYQDLSNVLLPGCPVLDDLVIHHEDFDGISYCISSRTIKKLKVHYDNESELDALSGMSFDAQSLVFLDYSDYAWSKYTPVRFPSLEEARLDIHYSKRMPEPNLLGLLRGISNVLTLHLSPDSTDVISLCIEQGLLLPRFNNLVSLSFGSKNKRGWKLLPHLLKQFPKIKTLIIKDLMHPQDLGDYTDNISMPPNKVKVLHILDYQGTPEELQLLMIFLGDFECLELLQVHVMEEDEERKAQTTEDLIKMLSGGYVRSKCQFEVT